MSTYTVPDRDREIQFDGELLGEISSRTAIKERWIELALYRTDAGSYVLAGIGRSTVPGEHDRKWAEISDEPDGIIEFLYLTNDHSQRFLPNTARQLLTQAAKVDEKIRQAYFTQHVA